MLYNQRPLVMRFALSASPATGLVITAAAATDDDFVWRGPGGSFIGKAPALGNFVVGAYNLRSRQWSAVTTLNWNTKKLIGNLAQVLNPVSSRLTGLTYLNLSSNQLAGLLSDVTLPTGSTYLNLAVNQLSGSFGDVTIPTNLATTYVNSNQLTYPSTGKCLSTVTKNSAKCYMLNNGMVQGHVDNVLADLVTSGTTGGTLNIAGSNAAPSAAGLANKTTLEGRGWTVTV